MYYWYYWSWLGMVECQEQLVLACLPHLSVSILPESGHIILTYQSPGLLNALMALVASLTNVYTAQDGDWSVTAIVSVSVAAFFTVFMGLMVLLYQFWFLQLLKRS